MLSNRVVFPKKFVLIMQTDRQTDRVSNNVYDHLRYALSLIKA